MEIKELAKALARKYEDPEAAARMLLEVQREAVERLEEALAEYGHYLVYPTSLADLADGVVAIAVPIGSPAPEQHKEAEDAAYAVMHEICSNRGCSYIIADACGDIEVVVEWPRMWRKDWDGDVWGFREE